MHYSNARVTVSRTNADGWVRSSSSACRVTGPRSLASARTTAMVAGTFLPGSWRQCCRAFATMGSSGSVETSDASPAAAPARTSGSGSCVRLTSTPVSCGRFRRRAISAAQYRWSERPESRSSSIRVLQLGSGGPSATARLAASPTRSRSSSNTDTGCGVVRSARLRLIGALSTGEPADTRSRWHIRCLGRRDAPVRGRCGGSKAVAEAPNPLYSSQL